jgi:predicted methyltransferase
MGLVLVSSAGPAFGQAAATAEPATAEPATTAASLTKSVRPGINDNFLDPNLDPDEWLQRFEVESREVFAARDEVMAALALEPGMHVADVGAGTGFYAATFAR